MSYKKIFSRKAFTMIEMAVVITVIALIAGGIMAVTSLREKAKLQKVINDIFTYRAAIGQFKDIYNYYPGDFPYASTFWSGASNGTGDGIIYWASGEDYLAWNHLGETRAGLIKGYYTGAVASASCNYLRGVNTPATSIPNGIFVITREDALYQYSNWDVIAGAIYLSSPRAADCGPNQAAVTPQDAYYIDNKIDDGKASTGHVFAFRGMEYFGAARCVDGTVAGASANYYFADTTISCRMAFWLNDKTE
jgi:prepilin-type N-terminal cleavage/methylation domain-containing protein